MTKKIRFFFRFKVYVGNSESRTNKFRLDLIGGLFEDHIDLEKVLQGEPVITSKTKCQVNNENINISTKNDICLS